MTTAAKSTPRTADRTAEQHLGMLTRNDLRAVLIEALTGAADALRRAEASERTIRMEYGNPRLPDGNTATMTIDGKIALSVEEAAETLGIGRTGVYRLLRDQELRSIKLGRRVLIPTQALLALVAATPED